MISKKISFLVLLTLTEVSSLAIADPFYTGTITNADHGLYLALEGGYGIMLGIPDQVLNTTGTHDVGGFVWGGNVGYAWALDAISAVELEVGYSDNGQDKYSGSGGVGDTGILKITSRDYQFLGGFTTTWDSGINLFVKLGAAVVNQKANLSNTVIIDGTSVPAFTNNKYFIEPMAVIGLGYKFTPNLNTYLALSGIYGNSNSQWSNMTLTPSGINTKSAVLAAKVGISYSFGS